MENALASVTSYRMNAIRLLTYWTRAWSIHMRGVPMSQSDANYLIAKIQTTFWKTFRRNPTVLEWVNSILTGRAAPIVQRTEDTLHVLRPWWLDFQVAGRDEELALGQFSKRVGDAFLFMSIPRQSDSFVPLGLTTELKIHAFVREVAAMHKPKRMRQNLLDAIYSCVRVLRRFLSLNPKDCR